MKIAFFSGIKLNKVNISYERGILMKKKIIFTSVIAIIVFIFWIVDDVKREVESALNKYGKKKYIPFRFNEQRKIKENTIIKHFCKGIVFFLPFGFHIYNIKQWNREKVHKSLKIFMFDDIYERVDKYKGSRPSAFKRS